MRTEFLSGRLTGLTGGGVAVREDIAKAHGWRIGDQVTMQFPVGGSASESIRAIYKDNQINGGYLISLADYQRHYTDQFDTVALVIAKPGASPNASRAAIDRVVADFPSVQVKDQAQYKQDQASQINQVLILFYLLLALAVIIAFIGIINTLALSVLERVRELGLLRALGMTRGQVRTMIRWEAMVITLLGAVLGLLVGTFFGWVVVRALHSQGITEFTLPIGTLLEFVLAAAIAGVLAAVFPGPASSQDRRAGGHRHRVRRWSNVQRSLARGDRARAAAGQTVPPIPLLSCGVIRLKRAGERSAHLQRFVAERSRRRDVV